MVRDVFGVLAFTAAKSLGYSSGFIAFLYVLHVIYP